MRNSKHCVSYRTIPNSMPQTVIGNTLSEIREWDLFWSRGGQWTECRTEECQTFKLCLYQGKCRFSKFSKLDLAKSIQHPTASLFFSASFQADRNIFLQSFRRHALKQPSPAEPGLSLQCCRCRTEGQKCALNIGVQARVKSSLPCGK